MHILTDNKPVWGCYRPLHLKLLALQIPNNLGHHIHLAAGRGHFGLGATLLRPIHSLPLDPEFLSGKVVHMANHIERNHVEDWGMRLTRRYVWDWAVNVKKPLGSNLSTALPILPYPTKKLRGGLQLSLCYSSA